MEANINFALFAPIMRLFSLKQQKTIFTISLFLIFILCFRFYYKPNKHSEVVKEEIAIEVSGEVKRPGIYLFNSPPTLKEAIEMAGGLKEKALIDSSSSKEILEPGTLINVKRESPQEIKIKIGKMEAQKLILFSIPIDLNKASPKDLCLIPEIGESIAQEILSYRRKIGKFRSIDELKNVKGIGEIKFLSIKNYFSIAGVRQIHQN